MYTPERLERITDELQILEIVRRQKPQFRILYRYIDTGKGVEVTAVYLLFRGEEFQLPLGTVLLVLFAFLARHTQLAQTAGQIEQGIRAERLYRRPMGQKSRSRNWNIPRRYIRVYVERTRKAIGRVFANVAFPASPDAVLSTEQTVMNEVGYRLRAAVEWQRTAF